MFKDHTTIIVGAGASKEFEMPLGHELLGEIARALKTGPSPVSQKDIIRKAVRQALDNCVSNGRAETDLQSACAQIVDGMIEANSIDEYMHTRRGNEIVELIGKIAIVSVILAREEGSLLGAKNESGASEPKLKKVQDKWLPRLRKMLTGDCSKIEIPDRLSKINLIVFNYDRCVEHYLYHSLKTYHHLSDDEIKSNMNYLKVIHPYGKVGFLPWQTKNGGTPYGARLDGTEILSLTDQIQTFTEQAKDPTIKHSIDDAIGLSRQVIFLGFAYHKQNLELLRLNDLRGNNKFVYGTTKGFSDSDTDHLRNTLRSMYCPATQADDRVQLTSCSCSELLDVHKFRLQN